MPADTAVETEKPLSRTGAALIEALGRQTILLNQYASVLQALSIPAKGQNHEKMEHFLKKSRLIQKRIMEQDDLILFYRSGLSDQRELRSDAYLRSIQAVRRARGLCLAQLNPNRQYLQQRRNLLERQLRTSAVSRIPKRDTLYTVQSRLIDISA